MKTLILLFISFNFLSSTYAAQRKRVNTKKIEKKYWTPKKYKTGVVQGRSFFKENRLRVGFENLILLNDKYSKTDGLSNYRIDASYYFNERLSFGGFFEQLSLDDNAGLREMSNFSGGGFILEHVKPSNFIGGSIDFVPIYSKLSWMNKKIIYLDFSISAKAGLATYQQQTLTGYEPEKTSPLLGVDFATNIFINNNFSINLAYRTRAYQAEVIDFNSTESSKVVVDDSKTNFHSFLTLGLNYYF